MSEQTAVRWIVERWQEMQSARTPASYQVRLCHVPRLLEELQSVARLEQGSGGSRWSSHRHAILEEIENRMRDPHQHLDERVAGLVSSFTNSVAKDAVGLEAQLQTLIEEIGEYGEFLVDRLSQLETKLGDGESAVELREKKKWDQLLGLIATHLCMSGVPMSGHRVDFGNPDEFTTVREVCDWLRTQLSEVDENRLGELFLVVRGNPALSEERLASETKSVLAGLESTLEGVPGPLFVQAKESKKEAALRLLNSASNGQLERSTSNGPPLLVYRSRLGRRTWSRLERQSHWQQLRTLLDLHGFHLQQMSAALLPAILTNDGAQWTLERVSSEVHGVFEPRDDATQQIRDMSKATGGLKAFPNQLRDVLYQYSLALMAPSAESRLVTMWSAMETLVGTAENKLPHVQRFASSIVAHQGIVRRLRYLEILMHETNLSPKEIPFASSRHEVEPVPLLRYLSTCKAQRSHDHDNTFLGAIGSKSLLLRTRICWEHEALSDRNATLKRLQSSEKNVEWNVARIYRMRNLLVHGTGSEFTVDTRDADRLAVHLQDYVATLVNRVLTDLKLGRARTVRQSLERRVLLFRELCASLKQNQKNVRVDQLLPDAGEHYAGSTTDIIYSSGSKMYAGP